MSVVAEHLRDRGVDFDVIPHDKAYTSIEEAQTLGIDADEVLKCIVLDTSSGHAMAVVPGGRRLDMSLVRLAVADNHARLATEEEVERGFPDYELGALPPLASLLRVPTLVDPEVMKHDTIVFAAGTQTESVRGQREDLFRGEEITIVPLIKALDEVDKEPPR
jgi:Ala-tRNA(Pro) deacylase